MEIVNICLKIITWKYSGSVFTSEGDEGSSEQEAQSACHS